MEVLVVYAKKLEDVAIKNVIVEFPDEMFAQFQRTLGNTFVGETDISYISARKFTKHEQPNQIREALMKGYVEMSHINLSICSECLHAEYEAEHMVERLVSGG